MVCVVCLKPVEQGELCKNCRKKSSWEDIWAVGPRIGVLKELIDQYKFERVMAADDVLVSLLDARLPVLPPNTVVTYVPTISAHARQRGYDAVQRVAKKLAKTRGLPCQKLLNRTTDVSQRGSSRQKRLIQQYDSLMARPLKQNGPILLIDDIFTTGGTLMAATKRLKEVCDAPIYCAVIALQPLDDLSGL